MTTTQKTIIAKLLIPEEPTEWMPYSPGEADAIVAGRDFDRLPYSHRARWLRAEALRIGRIQFSSAGAKRER